MSPGRALAARAGRVFAAATFLCLLACAARGADPAFDLAHWPGADELKTPHFSVRPSEPGTNPGPYLAYGEICLQACRAYAVRAAAAANCGGPVPAPDQGAYTGAYIDFGETEDTVTPEAIRAFEMLVGKHQAIVASSSYWGRETFPTGNVRIIADYGAIPLIYWSPWGPPYEQGSQTRAGRWSLAHIVAGDCDAYIDKWAAAARDFGRPLLVSFGNEPNSNWFPWSGLSNGSDGPSPGGGAGFAGPEMYKRAYRRAVDRVRAAGARNVAWVFHANNDDHPDKNWNALREYYPGSDYVDWLGLSVYGQLTPGKDQWEDWDDAMDQAYARLCQLDPQKPVMLAEWGVGEFPTSGNKGEFIREAFRGLNGGKYPRVKAAVFWHERWQNGDESWSNLRVQSSPGSLKAYREGVANPLWVDRVK